MAENNTTESRTEVNPAPDVSRQAAPAPEKKTGKKLTGRLKKIVYLAAALLIVIIVTNPNTLIFLPSSWRAKMLNAWRGLFGDVTSISKTIILNWISIFKVIVVILFMALLTQVLHLILEKIQPKNNKEKSLNSMLNSFVTYGGVLVGLIWCLSAIGINLSTIFASVGIVALIIGFAAESLIEDIITGIFLVFEDEFNVGDIIEFNGFRGTVISIGIRVTCIQDPGGNVKIVNNSDIRNVLNRSKNSSFAICEVPISYAANLEEAEKVLDAIMATMPEKYPDVFSAKPSYLGVQALDTSSVNLKYCADVAESAIYKASRLMNREVKLGLDAAGVEIPFTQVVVHQAQD